MKLSELIKKYRKEHGLSMRTFADVCGVSHTYISMLEKGVNPSTGEAVTPQLPQHRKLALGMGMSVHELLSSVEDLNIDIGETEQPAVEIPQQEYREELAGQGFRLLLDADSKLTKEQLNEIVSFIKYQQQKNDRT